MKFVSTIILGIIISACNSCSHRKDMGFNQRPGEHFQLYTYPDKLKSHEQERDNDVESKKVESNKNQDRYQRVVIASINDFQGAIEPHYFVKVDKRFNTKTTIPTGGIAAIKTYSDILKKYYDQNVLLVDPGNFLGKSNNLQQLSFYRNYLNIDVTSLSANDFGMSDYNYGKLKSIVAQSKSPVVVSNAFALEDAQPLKWRNLKSAYITNVGGIKVGFVGIVSPQNVLKMDKKNFTGIYFQDPAQTLMQEALNLRRNGAQIIVALFHSGINCTAMLSHDEGLPPEKVNFKQEEVSFCDFYENELVKTIKKLPPQTIDLVVTGGKNSKVVNFINGYPIMQNFGKGRYINWVELFYDNKMKGLVREKTRLYQPVELCHRFIKSTEDCFTKDSINDFDLTNAKFLGSPVNIDPLPIQKK